MRPLAVKMNFKRLTYPTTTIITLQEAKDHLRVTANDEDAVILDCIKAATNLVEKDTNQFFLSGSCCVYMDSKEFCSYEEITIWAYPVNEVSSIKYLDTDGVEQTFATSNYSTDLTDSPIRILPITIASVKANVVNQYRIYLNVGYLNRDQIDAELINWVKIWTAFFYETRQPEYIGTNVSQIAYKWEIARDRHRKDPII